MIKTVNVRIANIYTDVNALPVFHAVQTLPENAVIHDYVKKRHSVSYPVAMTSDKRSFDRPLLVPNPTNRREGVSSRGGHQQSC